MKRSYIDFSGLAIVRKDAMGDEEFKEPRDLFPMTRWSLVARSRDIELAGKALSELCEIYWYPVYTYIRCLGKDHHDAEDLTQGFLASMLDRSTFQKGDAQRGKLRVFLIVAVRRFVISADRKDSRLKRGGGAVIASLDAERAESRFNDEPLDPNTPVSRFEQTWATTVIENTMKALKAEYEAKDKSVLLEAMLPYVSLNARDEEKQGLVADRLGMKINAFRMSLTRMRQRYGELLRQTIADTLSDPSEVEEELAYLFGVVGR